MRSLVKKSWILFEYHSKHNHWRDSYISNDVRKTEQTMDLERRKGLRNLKKWRIIKIMEEYKMKNKVCQEGDLAVITILMSTST